jgi:hypothetical protein
VLVLVHLARQETVAVAVATILDARLAYALIVFIFASLYATIDFEAAE